MAGRLLPRLRQGQQGWVDGDGGVARHHEVDVVVVQGVGGGAVHQGRHEGGGAEGCAQHGGGAVAPLLLRFRQQEGGEGLL
ncbi:hypothetical protein HRbin25_00723 [bacterium HR25]|nr:hypothetical protein HRbin25_00723 [bacterium HR25]